MSQRPITLLLLAFVAASCAKPSVPVNISFEARFGESTLSCDDPSTNISLTDLRLYVQQVQLRDSNGELIAVTLSEDRWQHHDLALLDLEDGNGRCINGTQEVNFQVRGELPVDTYRGLQFEVGVPFELNHKDALAAAAPLADPAMHWHWRGGYKFLRAGLTTENDGFWMHLGSAGCVGKIGAITSCRYPNRVTVHLPEFDPDRHTVVVDLAELAPMTELADGLASDCSSGPPESSCVAPFAAFGLDHQSGSISGRQRVFRIGDKQ